MNARVISSLAALTFVLTSACAAPPPGADHVVHVEIVDPVARGKFIEVLDKQGREYRLDGRARIVVKAASIEELEEDTKEYREWYNQHFTTRQSSTSE